MENKTDVKSKKRLTQQGFWDKQQAHAILSRGNDDLIAAHSADIFSDEAEERLTKLVGSFLNILPLVRRSPKHTIK